MKRRLAILTAATIGAAGAGAACSSSSGGDAAVATPADAGSDTSAPSGPADPPPNDAPCPASGVSKGPWSIAMTRTGVRVRWEACREGANGAIALRPEAGGDETIAETTATTAQIAERHAAPLNALRCPDDAPGTYWLHEAALDGLPPGTCYRYALVADRALGGRFCTARPDGADVHFVAIGDTNPLLGDATAKVLAHVLPLAPDFVVHGGDIQYYDSGLETWSGWFPAMQPLLSAAALLPALGNHEHEKDDELDLYSRRFFGWPDFGGATMWYRFESGGVFFHVLDTEESVLPGSPQGSWLAASLAEAKRAPGFRFSVVVMHRPFVTCGDNAENDTARKAFASAFAQYRVPLVLQAHVHGYERFAIDGVTFVTTGGGGGLLGDMDQNVSRAECAMRAASGAFFHALDVTASGKEIRAKAIDDAGAVRDAFTIAVP